MTQTASQEPGAGTADSPDASSSNRAPERRMGAGRTLAGANAHSSLPTTRASGQFASCPPLPRQASRFSFGRSAVGLFYGRRTSELRRSAPQSRLGSARAEATRAYVDYASGRGLPQRVGASASALPFVSSTRELARSRRPEDRSPVTLVPGPMRNALLAATRISGRPVNT
jgi:hypothetical protein